MEPYFHLYLERKRIFQATLCLSSSNTKVKLTPCFFDQEVGRWVQSSEEILYLPIYSWPALSDYIPKIDQVWSLIEDKSICTNSKLGIILSIINIIFNKWNILFKFIFLM